MFESLFFPLYRKYYHEIFPRIEDYRGATRLALVLRKLAYSEYKPISEDQVEYIWDKKPDWKYVIIIDACRYDLYNEVREKNAESRFSEAPNTGDFVRKNFKDEDFKDTIYITGNPTGHKSLFEPQTGREAEDVFHSVYHTYEYGWKKEVQTVPPEEVFSDFKTAEKLFPDKKKIIHFMQPHEPFIGFDVDDYTIKGSSHPTINPGGKRIFGMAEAGWVDSEKIWRGYKKNLEVVMEYVEKIAEETEEDVVVTSDHGNLFGENGFYGHEDYAKTSLPLRKVPWEIM